MPTVSIIMPCRNAGATLAQTIASIRRQTFGDWELVCIDDGSTDESADLLAIAERLDGRIRVIGGPARGASAARNAGLRAMEREPGMVATTRAAAPRAARPGFVAFIDADDIWMPGRLAALLGLFERKAELDIAFSRFSFFRALPGDCPTTSTVPYHPLGVADLLHENPTGTMSNIMLRRDALDRIGLLREDMRHGEDREWLVRAAALGCRIEGLDSTLMHYRTSTGGLSADLEAMHDGWRESVDTARRLGALPDAAGMRDAEGAYLRYLARRALRLGASPPVAARYALRGALSGPKGFFGDRERGALTLGAALADAVAPRITRSILANR